MISIYMVSHRNFCKCHTTLVVAIGVGFEKVVDTVLETRVICYG